MSDTPPVDTEACAATSPRARSRYAKRGIILEMGKRDNKPMKRVGSAKHSVESVPGRVEDVCKNEPDLARPGGKHPDAKPLCTWRYASVFTHIGSSSELVLSQFTGRQQLRRVCATLLRTVLARLAEQEVAYA